MSAHFVKRSLLIGFLAMSLFASATVGNKIESAPTQVSPKPRSTPDVITIGVDLSLGMPEDATIKRIAEAGYTMNHTPPPQASEGIDSVWIIEKKGLTGRVLQPA